MTESAFGGVLIHGLVVIRSGPKGPAVQMNGSSGT